MKTEQSFHRILKCIKPALPKAAKTTIWLLKITIPVTFFVLVLNYTGWLAQISSGLQPFFNLLGLPAESAIIKKSGSSVFRMLTIRVIFSLIAGLFLNAILPQGEVLVQNEITVSNQSFPVVLKNWAVDMFFLGLKIISLVSILFIFQNILEEFGIIAWISRIMRPLMRILGLPESTSVSLIVVNTIGLAYGAAVVLDQLDKNKMNRKDADLLNHHAVISHSQIEDPLLFLALGITIHWLIWPRIILAILVVWLRKLELRLKKSRQGKVQLAYGSA